MKQFVKKIHRDGRFTVTLGEYGPNNNPAFRYDAESVANAIKTPAFHKQLEKGLFGEINTPKVAEGQDQYERMTMTALDRLAFKIISIDLHYVTYQGTRRLVVRADIIPFGPFAFDMARLLEKKSKYRFGMRALANQVLDDVRVVSHIITWDIIPPNEQPERLPTPELITDLTTIKV